MSNKTGVSIVAKVQLVTYGRISVVRQFYARGEGAQTRRCTVRDFTVGTYHRLSVHNSHLVVCPTKTETTVIETGKHANKWVRNAISALTEYNIKYPLDTIELYDKDMVLIVGRSD